MSGGSLTKPLFKPLNEDAQTGDMMDYERTVVLEKDYLEKAQRESRPAPLSDSATNTRVISSHLVVRGVRFSWWAIDENPSLVTVRSLLFGSEAEFTRRDVKEFAAQLAERVLTVHFARVARHSKSEVPAPSVDDSTTLLKKPGWFEQP